MEIFGPTLAHVIMLFPRGPNALEQELAFGEQPSLKHQKEVLEMVKEQMAAMTPEQIVAEDKDKHLERCEKGVAKAEAAAEAREKVIDFFTNEIGISEVHPNLNPFSWKPPFGNNYVEPVENVLRQTLDENMTSDENLQISHERLVNRVQTHSCTYK